MGPALCLFSAACFGAMAIFGKLAYAAGVSPGALLLLRFSVAAVLLGLLLALRPGLRATSAVRERPAGTSRVRVVVTALGLGAVGYATQATLYFSALQRIDASLVGAEGSRVQCGEFKDPPAKSAGQIIEDEDTDDTVEKIVAWLDERKLI